MRVFRDDWRGVAARWSGPRSAARWSSWQNRWGCESTDGNRGPRPRSDRPGRRDFQTTAPPERSLRCRRRRSHNHSLLPLFNPMNPLADGTMGGLYLGVFRDASHAGLAPPAGLFEPANRQFGAPGTCCIDPAPASPDPAGDGQCCADFGGLTHYRVTSLASILSIRFWPLQFCWLMPYHTGAG